MNLSEAYRYVSIHMHGQFLVVVRGKLTEAIYKQTKKTPIFFSSNLLDQLPVQHKVVSVAFAS